MRPNNLLGNVGPLEIRIGKHGVDFRLDESHPDARSFSRRFLKNYLKENFSNPWQKLKYLVRNEVSRKNVGGRRARLIRDYFFRGKYGLEIDGYEIIYEKIQEKPYFRIKNIEDIPSELGWYKGDFYEFLKDAIE